MDESDFLEIGKNRFAEFLKKKHDTGTYDFPTHSSNGIDEILRDHELSLEESPEEALPLQLEKGSPNNNDKKNDVGVGGSNGVEMVNGDERLQKSSHEPKPEQPDNSELILGMDTLRLENQKLENLNNNLSTQLRNQGDELAILREDNTRLIQEFDSLMRDDYPTRQSTPKSDISLQALAGSVQERCHQMTDTTAECAKMSKNVIDVLKTICASRESGNVIETSEILDKCNNLLYFMTNKQNLESTVSNQLKEMRQMVDPVSIALGGHDPSRFSGTNSKQMQKIQQDASELEKIVGDEKKKNSSLINQNLLLQRRIDEVEQEKQLHVSSLKQSLNNISLEMAALQQELESSNQAINHYRKLATDSADESMQFSNKLNERQLEVETLQRDMSSLKEELGANTSPKNSDEKSETTHDFDKLLDRIEQTDTEKRELQQTNERLRLERDIITAKYEKIKNWKHKDQQELDPSEETESEPKSQEHEELIAELEITKQKVKQLGDDKFYLAEQLDGSYVEIENLSRQVIVLEQELEEVSQSRDERQQLSDVDLDSQATTDDNENKEISQPKPNILLPHLNVMPMASKNLAERRPLHGLGAHLKPAFHTNSSGWTSFFSFFFSSWFSENPNIAYRV